MLHIVTDIDGWWSIHCVDTESGATEPVLDDAAAGGEHGCEFGVPAWVFAQATYGWDGRRHAVVHMDVGRRRTPRDHPRRTPGRDSERVHRLWTACGHARRLGGHRGRQLDTSGCCGGGRVLTVRPPPAQRQRALDSGSRRRLGARGVHLRQRRWTPGPRVLLPARQLGRARTTRRPAAALGAEPRRTHRLGPQLAGLGHPVLDQPRHRRGGRELQRQHRLRHGLPQPAARPVGRRRHTGLHRRGTPPGRRGRRGRPAPRHQGAALQGATPRCAR